MDENDRVLVRGGAGSGKTLLAVEEARRIAARNERVFFCCFNKHLAAFLRGVTHGLPGVDVHHLHGFMAAKVKDGHLQGRLAGADKDELWSKVYPTLCLEALLSEAQPSPYDVIIVDEAQDLLLPSYLMVFDALLKGELSNGRWRFFYDPNQDIFHRLSGEAVKALDKAHPVRLRLSVNCRNTVPVATATRILSGVDCRETLRIEGPAVSECFCRDGEHQRREVSKCVNRLLSEQIPPTEIVILSRCRLENSCLRAGLINVRYPLRAMDEAVQFGENNIRFATIASFKGLEADAVLLSDVDDLTDDDSLLSVYVGASRARAFLALFLDETLKARYGELAREFGRRVAAEGTGVGSQ